MLVFLECVKLLSDCQTFMEYIFILTLLFWLFLFYIPVKGLGSKSVCQGSHWDQHDKTIRVHRWQEQSAMGTLTSLPLTLRSRPLGPGGLQLDEELEELRSEGEVFLVVSA